MSYLSHESWYDALMVRAVPLLVALVAWIALPDQLALPAFLGGFVAPKVLPLLVASVLVALVRTVYVLARARRSRGSIFLRRPVSVGSYWLVPVLYAALFLLDSALPDASLFSLLKGLLLGLGVGAASCGLALPRMSYATARSILRPRPRSAWEFQRIAARLSGRLFAFGSACLVMVAVL